MGRIMKLPILRLFVLCLALLIGRNKTEAQLIFLQGEAAPIQPFEQPDATDRLMAKKNRIKATLRFGYLSDNKEAEALRRRTEFNFQGFPSTVYDFSTQGKIEAKKEYAYDLGGTTILKASIEKYRGDGDLEVAYEYEFMLDGKLSAYREVDARGHERRIAYTYNVKGKLLRLQYVEPDGLPGGAEAYAYDASGLSASMDKTDIAGDLMERVTWSIDPKGRITGENRYTGGSNPILLFSYKYLYDEKGRLSRKEKYSRDLVLSGWETWIFDNAGRVTEHKTLQTGEEKPFKETFKYDGAGRLSQNINYNGDGSIFQSYKYSYDSLGTGAGMQRLLPDGKVDFKKVQVFSKARQLLMQTETYEDGSGDVQTIYRYTPEGLLLEEKHLSNGNEESIFWFVHEQY